MTWRVAQSLLVLRDQINAAYPGRSTASDGTIGDAAHQSQGSDSDHNPWVHLYGDQTTGVVTALDITHDPAHGCDINALTDELAATRDPRIKYLIANALILSGNDGPSPWVWRPYGGSDPHTNHFHLSVVADPRCDDVRPWGLANGSTPSTGGSMTAIDPLHYSQHPAFPSVVRAIVEGATEEGFVAATGVKWDDAAANVNLTTILAGIKALASTLGSPQTSGAPTQEQVNTGILNAMLDPAVQAGIGAAVASHLKVV